MFYRASVHSIDEQKCARANHRRFISSPQETAGHWKWLSSVTWTLYISVRRFIIFIKNFFQSQQNKWFFFIFIISFIWNTTDLYQGQLCKLRIWDFNFLINGKFSQNLACPRYFHDTIDLIIFRYFTFSTNLASHDVLRL
jgi:hypothetical protein